MLGWLDARPLSLAITPDRARKLADKPKLKTLTDAVMFFPNRYVRASFPDAQDLMFEGEMFTCIARVEKVEERSNTSGRGARRYMRVQIVTGSTRLSFAMFGNVHLHRTCLQPGNVLMFYGKLALFRQQWELKNVSYVSVFVKDESQFGAFGPLKTVVDIAGSDRKAMEILNRPWLPFYPRRVGTTTAEMLGVMEHVLSSMGDPTEMLPSPRAGRDAPAWPVDQYGAPLLDFATALRQIHQPPVEGPEPARARLKFNEALELQLVMALRRADATQRSSMPMVLGAGGSLRQAVVDSLPFELSEGQIDASAEIAAALDSTTPASLLLQGEVGSGKTVVALLAMLQAIEAGYQCAFVAPTEVLAVQHARTLVELLGRSTAGSAVGVTVLTGSQKTADRKAALLDVVSGQASIVVGTHAVIQETVEFFNLGLVIVDEQHRFGVRQRDKLRDNSPVDRTPHMMVMTATPIPRTVAMTMFGDLTPVRLPGLPKRSGGTARQGVSTTVVALEKPHWVARVWQRCREELAAGRQAFIVTPRIEGFGGVLQTVEWLSQTELHDYRVGVLHGKMPADEKDEVMSAFAAGEIDALVATTIVEVGVDIPNATMMIILGADAFGVSQLHQLRGRVGRGEHGGVCLLLPSDQSLPPATMERLHAVASTTDGFELAELDLKQRTEGDVLGADQSGSRVRRSTLLDLTEDEFLINQAREYAEALVRYDEPLARALVVDIEVEEQDYIERH
ncbi:ATP-dependent DNA helicase RecG [Corynebacterium auriscanis]|uniref:ATP-dependent DNA helicase RecG n=1 Tax=Corynebacterium auriscanis TaxID=99807 RepID=UPI0024AD284B|nr:ATP-dependent DNA helicase RecG [Corynebacterium auriscanis]